MLLYVFEKHWKAQTDALFNYQLVYWKIVDIIDFMGLMYTLITINMHENRL